MVRAFFVQPIECGSEPTHIEFTDDHVVSRHDGEPLVRAYPVKSANSGCLRK